MKKQFFFAAVAIVALASCADQEYVGDSPTPNPNGNGNDNAIVFSSGTKAVTRGDIYGSAAADLLGQNFYVIGTKGTEQSKYPTENIVFDNYLVHYGVNTAGTTESNTANWEYVGVVPGTAPTANYVKLSSLNAQTIKYWDYSTDQYDFWAFSTGSMKAVSKTALTGEGKVADDEIGVTASIYGSALDVASSTPTAYTLYIPTVVALKEAYITDITEVVKENYGKEVTLKFKNLGSKVRVALYETVPGYSVKDVKFYTSTTSPIKSGTEGYVAPTETATLISGDTYGFSTKGQIDVSFPHVGTTYETGTSAKADYNKAVATVTPTTASSERTLTFDALTANYSGKDPGGYEAAGKYLGRTLPNATFAGSSAAQYYQTVFPVSSPAPITLRVDYTLVSTDGSGEEIKIYGANAVIPSTYTKWLPNYAYTYVFKISDNTNGWTDVDATKAGLFPITFDAVVAEVTDANAEQTTVTTVATPSITTYQQGHNTGTNGAFTVPDEYSKTSPEDKDIYVQVMDNEPTTPVLVGTTGSTKPLLNVTSPYTTSLLYAVTTTGKEYEVKPAGWPTGYYTDATYTTEASGDFSTSTTYYKRCTEADVMDALENQSSVDAGNITGRNGVVLTKNDNINAGVTSIVNGVDDNPITVAAGTAAMIDISALSAGTYAYVYDYTPSSPKTETTIYQPITLAVGATIPNGTRYITKDILDGITYDSNKTADNEAVSSSYMYFSKTTNGSGTTTYSFVSVDGKTTLPAGLLKVEINNTNVLTSNGSATVVAGTICFDKYIRNNGKYAVKVIKIVA